jgi:hypothetical protein
MSLSRITTLAAFAVAAVGFTAVHAQEEDSVERYTLEKTDKGYVRMDKSTGEISVCEITGSQMICRMGADDRKAFEAELDILTTRLDDLEKKVAMLEGNAPANSGNRLPNDEELDQTFDVMEKFFRRFMGIAKDLEEDFGSGTDQKPAPDKT